MSVVTVSYQGGEGQIQSRAVAATRSVLLDECSSAAPSTSKQYLDHRIDANIIRCTIIAVDLTAL